MVRYTRTKSRSCDGKQPFPDRHSAQTAIELRVREGAAEDALEVYPCGPHFHVGHRARQKRGRR